MNSKIVTYLTGLGIALLTATQASADPFLSSVTVGAQSPATIAAGASATYSMSLTKTNSGGIDAYLSISGLPAGATASFSPSPVIFKSGLNTGTSSLTIATTSGVADGTYSFVVTANDGNSPNNLTGTGTLVVGNGSVSSIQAPIILSISLVGGQTPNLVISGSAHQPYVIQATTDLANPSWTSITTNLTDATGLFAFADQGAMNLRSRFYRAALPH